MVLKVLPLEESDFPEFVRIQHDAFTSGNAAMTTLLKPSPLPPSWHEKSIEKHIKSWREESDVTYLKVIDTYDNAMIACAKWRINEKERTEEEIQGMLPVPGKDEEGRPAARDFMNYLARVRREYMGTKPFYFLHMLVTDPAHHRRGAGKMLIEWGTEKADKVQLPCFLEASEVGKPLYERMGFETKHAEVFDLGKYGLQGTDTNTVMIREPLIYVM
ncbi:hypothetical protein FB567DRAFT_149286 [Paraphoma chrysanthemicola]|uniref:N-acetyltransferase domain-containing protein n=1 Tax=Paraphoma chrysanthemicola TaxID=798071 RepID=A0A8K0VUN2_9PLEO|nr:hypothetical protein FB567DRAFT_149286 [Paraphoma chrysanthemicola]